MVPRSFPQAKPRRRAAAEVHCEHGGRRTADGHGDGGALQVEAVVEADHVLRRCRRPRRLRRPWRRRPARPSPGRRGSASRRRWRDEESRHAPAGDGSADWWSPGARGRRTCGLGPGRPGERGRRPRCRGRRQARSACRDSARSPAGWSPPAANRGQAPKGHRWSRAPRVPDHRLPRWLDIGRLPPLVVAVPGRAGVAVLLPDGGKAIPVLLRLHEVPGTPPGPPAPSHDSRPRGRPPLHRGRSCGRRERAPLEAR